VGPNSDLEAETMLAYELGHRIRLPGSWELDTALFYDDYSTLIGLQTPLLPWTDEGSGETYGAELSASWRSGASWVVEGSYSWLDVEIEGPVLLQAEETAVPQSLAQLRSSWRATSALELHGALYYVDRIVQPRIDSYERLDLGVTWRPRTGIELGFWGQNLLESEHAETSAVAIPRSLYGMITIDL